ncbi:cytochrome d ubiquinol oxidase subunit II [Enterococcus gallinarum]|uniref:cytochrome d ubiquinol oxidase subunit II n=1 Tax=Enterococcus gallinarum TaxID=1353 RepID=UPI0018AB2F98|nr:cytochrome d ubiquinol oxidase subunit II [Enterococcus gallinarum]
MTNLQLLWFILIGILFAGFFFLEGFDFGVGMSIQTLAHNEKERDQLIRTIGPFWDGNEVWLLTAGGAMFASFPYWYASLFSGFYLILLLILVGLIIRGVSFEFREHFPEERKGIWNWTLTIGSGMVPFFFGLMFVDLIKGMPLGEEGNMTATFTDFVNPFSVVGGVALTLLCYLHGLNYIALKTEGPIRARARNYASFFYWILLASLVVFAGILYVKTDFFVLHFATTVGLLIGVVLLTLTAMAGVFKGKEQLAFIASGLTLIALVALIFTGLFPRVMISSIDSSYDLLIANASSSPYTLKIMSYLSLTILPFVLAYTVWSYYIFRKRVRHDSAIEE